MGERYQVEDLLGKGGFGAVYLVRDLRVRQNVFALKEIADPDQGQRRHFTFEAELLKRTDHPSLPRVYRAFDDPSQGRAYMLMDYIEGSNLEKLRRLRPEQRLPLNEVLSLARPIVEALTYLHSQKPPIIHRDIKPSNIIAPDSGERAVLVDLGIAKEFDQEGTTTAIRHATPGYGAPEQYSSGTDRRTDIYGLGATLYALLTGTVPIDAFFRMTQQMSKRGDPLVPVKQLLPDIPVAISEAIARAMALDKNERFSTVEEFWQHVQAAGEPDPDAAPANASPDELAASEIGLVYHPVSAKGNAPSRSRTRWIVAIILLFLALGVATASALVLLAGLHSPQAHTPAVKATSTTIAHTPAVKATSTTIARAPTALPSPSPTATSRVQATATPKSTVPELDAAYNGTIQDTNGSVTTSMSLNGISQNGQAIQGNFTVGPDLRGNGPFTGSVQTNSSLQFTVHSTDAGIGAPLFFSGQIASSGRISGQYCSLNTSGHCDPNAGGYGTWSVQPANGGS